MTIPFLVVLAMPKSVGARLCLLGMISLNLILDMISYGAAIYFIMTGASWWLDQAMDRDQPPYTDAGRYSDPEDYNDKLIDALNMSAKWSAGIAYGMIGAFIFVLALRGAIWHVYYKFYTTGRDSSSKM